MYHSNYLIGPDIESRRDAVPSKMFSVVVMIRMFFFCSLTPKSLGLGFIVKVTTSRGGTKFSQ